MGEWLLKYSQRSTKDRAPLDKLSMARRTPAHLRSLPRNPAPSLHSRLADRCKDMFSRPRIHVIPRIAPGNSNGMISFMQLILLSLSGAPMKSRFANPMAPRSEARSLRSVRLVLTPGHDRRIESSAAAISAVFALSTNHALCAGQRK